MDFLKPEHLIATFGLIGIFAIIFAESGLLIGFFLPGDSLLFVAGLFASQHKYGINIWVLVLGCFLAAFIGDQVGYTFGHKVGPALFRKPDSKLFKQEYVDRTEAFFEKHGPKTIILARFVPIVRTFAPVVAGVGRMNRRTFLTYNLVGAFLWAVGVTLAGYFLGSAFPVLGKYIEYIAIGIIVVSVIPVGLEVRKMRKEGKANRAASTDVTGEADLSSPAVDLTDPTHAPETLES
jgi:membrane-associated protein